MNENEDASSVVLNALLQVRIQIDMLEDLLAQEIRSIADLIDEPGNDTTNAHSRLIAIAKVLESDERTEDEDEEDE